MNMDITSDAKLRKEFFENDLANMITKTRDEIESITYQPNVVGNEIICVKYKNGDEGFINVTGNSLLCTVECVIGYVIDGHCTGFIDRIQYEGMYNAVEKEFHKLTVSENEF